VVLGISENLRFEVIEADWANWDEGSEFLEFGNSSAIIDV